MAKWLMLALGVGASACHMDSPSSATSDSESHVERVPIGEVLWYVDYDAALEVAREQDKALWAHFGENPG